VSSKADRAASIKGTRFIGLSWPHAAQWVKLGFWMKVADQRQFLDMRFDETNAVAACDLEVHLRCPIRKHSVKFAAPPIKASRRADVQSEDGVEGFDANHSGR
jgi:hypothetical protein